MYVWLNGWMVDLLDGLSMYGLIDVSMVEWVDEWLGSCLVGWLVE